MATITTRSGKGSPLTHAEGDANFNNLNNDKLENINSENLGDLANVSSSAPSDGQVLQWNNTASEWQPQTASSGASTLVDLTDTSIASPSEGQVLAYNSASSKFTNQGIDITNKSINDLSDVSASGPSDGQVLTYSSANSRFEAQTPSSGGGGSVAHIRLGNADSSYGSSGDTAAGMLAGASTDSYWDTSWITFSATGSPSNWKYNFTLQPGEYSLVTTIKPATSNSGSGTYRIYNVSNSSFNSNGYEQYWAEWKDISDFNAVIPFIAVLAPSCATTSEFAMGSRDQLPDSILITKLS